MNWLQRISQVFDAADYFSIGHGEYDTDLGFEPKYIVWAYLGGAIQSGPEGYPDGVIQDSDQDLPHGGTHGSLWGHHVTDYTYKGRYEPETGRLTIAKPINGESDPIPGEVMRALYNKFPNITKVVEF